MSHDSSSNNTISSTNNYPSSMETVNFLSYLLGENEILNRDSRASPINFINDTTIYPNIFFRNRLSRRRIPLHNRYNMTNYYSNHDASNHDASNNDASLDVSSSTPNAINNTSENIYTRFLEDILQLPILPIAENQQQTFRELLQQTFVSDKNPIKKVLSEEGEKCIKDVVYNSEIHSDINCCPITMKEFKNGDTIAELPCKHRFNKSAILKWLKEEKAKCPICRAELKSVEKKEPQQDTPEPTTENQRPIQRQNNRYFNFRPPGIARPGRTEHFRRLLMTRQQREEEEELQAALLASLEDQYMPSNKKYNETQSETQSEYSSDSDFNLSSNDEMNCVD